MFYTRTSDGNYVKTVIPDYKAPMINRDTKVFKLSNGSILKTNNQIFLEVVPKVPEGYLSAEVLWDGTYKPSDITHTILY
jgi:hypothetical protein